MKKIYIVLLSFLIGVIFFMLFVSLYNKDIYFYLKGNDKVELNIGDEYKEQGFKAMYCSNSLKLFCKDITKLVKINKEESKNQQIITYKIKYNDINKSLTRKISYLDKESPTIELIDHHKSLCPNSDYIEEGYKAYDNVDGDITDKVIVTKKQDKVYYNVSDSSGNKKITYRTINYEDKESPVIILNDSGNSYIYLKHKYIDKGFTASDNCDGDITDKVAVHNNINTNKTGDYEVTYSITDSVGNKNTVTKKVIVYDDISKVPKNGKVVYLTFDDGPCSYTEDIMKVLNKYNVKATFFVTNQFSKYQNIIKKEYENGHTIGVHTYSHNYKTVYSSLENYINDFNNMNAIIYKQTGTYSNLFRFPGGSSNTISRFNKGIVTDIANRMSELGYYYFDWNIDSMDTSTTDPNIIFESVRSEIEKRDLSVVLMHDIKKANIESVDKIISYGLENGYTFLPLDENTSVIHHKINN